MKMKLIVFICLIMSGLLFAQKNPEAYGLKGTVVDLMTNKPLASVAVLIYSRTSGKELRGVSTDEKGNFGFPDIPEAKVRIKFSLVGYRSEVVDSVALNQTSRLGLIKLEPTTIEMPEVVVKTLKPMIEFHADKQVLNVERAPGSSGSVTEVLKNSGLVDVDPATNAITVRGQNLKIQMDGHQYDMPGEMLNQMPASMLDQVEVILAPGAKESAEGGTYILNLITKKNKFESISGSVSLSSYSNNRDYGGLSLNYKANKVNIYSQFYGGYYEFKNQSESETFVYTSPIMYDQRASAGSNYIMHYGYAKIGMDYDIDDHNSVTVYGSYNGYTYKGNNISENGVFNSSNAFQYDYSRTDNDQYPYNSYSLYGFYKKKFETKGNELTFDALFTLNENPDSRTMILGYSYLPGYPRQQNSNTGVHARTFIFKTDYVLPFKSDRLEAGYSFTYRNRNNDYNVLDYSYLLHNWQDSLKLSNQFIYKENINALYATYAYKLDNFDIKAGLRSENLHTEGDQITQQTNFTENYLSLFPNFNMSYKLSDMYQIGFNAFRRVTYPQIYYVNPFRQYEGPNSYLAGNPDLKPSYTSSFAFNFSQYINIYYTDVTGNFTYATSTEQDSILISSYINLNEINTYGIDLAFPYYNTPVMPFHLPEFISMVNIRFSYLYSKQTGQYLAQDLSMINKSYTLRANLGLKLWFGIDANISIYYRPRTENKLSVSSEYKNLYLYLSKTFMDKKLRISISATDLLNSSKMDYSSIGANYYTRNSYVPLNSRGIGIGISYMFNDFKERQDRNIDDGRDAGNKGGI